MPFALTRLNHLFQPQLLLCLFRLLIAHLLLIVLGGRLRSSPHGTACRSPNRRRLVSNPHLPQARILSPRNTSGAVIIDGS